MLLNVHVEGAALVVLMVSIVMHFLAIISLTLRFYRRQRQMNVSRRGFLDLYKTKSDFFIAIALVPIPPFIRVNGNLNSDMLLQQVLSVGHSIAIWIGKKTWVFYIVAILPALLAHTWHANRHST